jgi:hypothetical protein
VVSLRCAYSYVHSGYIVWSTSFYKFHTHIASLFGESSYVPQLTTLANIIPFLIVPVRVSYRVRRPRVMFPADRVFTRVDTGCELLLQDSNKFMCFRDNDIHVRLHNGVFRERCTIYFEIISEIFICYANICTRYTLYIISIHIIIMECI